MDTIDFINSLFKPQEQWAMSYAGNEPGMSLPEYHPEDEGVAEPNMSLVETTPDVELAAEGTPTADDVANMIQNMLAGIPRNTAAVPPSISKALDKLLGNSEELKARAQVGMYKGAVLKTIAAAGDLFDRGVGLMMGQPKNIRDTADIAAQNYQNQMDALDNQVLYIKHQLADRFNQTVETNIMNLAAKNIRVNAGNVLDLSKENASEITEDMRTAESNAELKKIALDAGKKQAKESANYAIKQLWTGFASSALKLGIMGATGGGTNEKWGDLYAGYKKGNDFLKAQKAGTLTGMYD
jgi:hypothetical protein